MVVWLDKLLQNWRLQNVPDTADESETLWTVQAETTADKLDSRLPGTLGAIHRARSAPASPILQELLSRAQSPFVSAFADAMQVEGRLKTDYDFSNEHGRLRASVVGPAIE